MKRTNSHLIARHPDNNTGLILESDDRDVCDSIFPQLASAAPTVNNDSVDTAGLGQEFGPGSRWFDWNHLVLWICVDGTPGAALWLRATPDTSGILAAANAYSDAGDAATLASAQSYADAGDAVVLVISPGGPRTPTAHATTHQPGGSDPMAVDAAAGTGSLRTLGTSGTNACAGNDSRLSNARTPTAHATTHQPGGSDPMAVDAAAGTGSLRTLGSSATNACAGNDSRLSDSRAPSGSAGGQLSGTYPNPGLVNVGTAGTYTKITTDAQGRVSSGDNVALSDLPRGLCYVDATFREQSWDFQNSEFAATGGTGGPWLRDSTNGGNAALEGGITGTWNVVRVHTGTSATTGAATLRHSSGGTPNFIPNPTNGNTFDVEYYFYTDILSASADRYSLSLGLIAIVGSAPSEGIYANYIDNANGGAFTLKTIKTTGGAASSSANGTGAALLANTLYRIRISITGTSATFYQDGTSIGTITGFSAPNPVTMAVSIVKSSGLNQRNVFVDWVRFKWSM